MPTIKDSWGDSLEITNDGRQTYINVEDAIEEGVRDFEFNPDDLRVLINTLASEAGITGVPEGGVKASDVSLNEALLRVAAAHNVPVTFRYAKSPTAPIESRTFVPAKLQTKADHVTFTGYDEDRGAVRAFRSDRIKGTVAVGS